MLKPPDLKASFKIRVLQFLIDLVIINLLLWLAFCFFHSLLRGNYFVILIVSITLYFFVLELLLSKTIGMMMMNIEIVYIYGEGRIDYVQALLRSLGRLICTLTLGIGYALQLHDYISETHVIINEKSNSPVPGWTVLLLKQLRKIKVVRRKR
jgi:uncharacterized RDD family membrane protein YckC